MADTTPLLVLALGGHALSNLRNPTYAGERQRIAALEPLFAELAETYRLLVVHGNGPQVGRLLVNFGDVEDLDIRTAQTQGELGYLLSQAMPSPTVTVTTRVIVPENDGEAVKPIGPVLPAQPRSPCRAVKGGWRVLVPSPRPDAVVELEAIAQLSATHHVIAGGGGGVPVTASGVPENVVVDKDWVALLLATALQAQTVVFATDVDGVYEAHDTAMARKLHSLTVTESRRLLAQGMEAGSMAPKLASAADFVEYSARPAVICAVEDTLSALAGDAGTRIQPAPG